VNSHRLLVKGHQVPYEEEVLEETITNIEDMSLHTNYLLWVIIGLGVTGVFIVILLISEKMRRKKVEQKTEQIE
jgi:sortase A